MSGPRAALPALRRFGSIRSTMQNRIRAVAANRENQEFLPAHLEILEAPASPYASVFVWTLCALFTSAILWSCFTSLDIYAVASARIQPSGRSKLIQPFETSKVQAILVHDGDTVQAGDHLIELNSTEARAELDAHESELESLEAQLARNSATITALQTGPRNIEPDFSADVPLPIRAREKAAMKTVLAQYDATCESLKAQIAEKVATQQRYSDSIDARERLRATLKERSDMREKLVASSSGTRAAVIDALQQVQQVAADLASEQGQFVEAQAGVRSLERRIDQLTSETVAGQTRELTEASQKRDNARQDVIKAWAKHERTHLVSPINGTVQQLAVTSVGQVVTAGQPLAVVVPTEGPVEIEALVLNADIGFVAPGQPATIKIDSFPFTRYGSVQGKVMSVSRDAVDAHDAGNSAEALSLATAHNSNSMLGTPQTQNLVFPVTIGIGQNDLVSDGKPVVLTAGMTATVDIHTGSRRVIDYILSPMKETSATAGHER